jgi:hypothetical protein
MRAILVTLLLATATAHADSVLVMAEPGSAGELDAAMRVVLSGRGTAIASMPAPAGQMRLERAAAAQRAAAQTGADAAVWIDEAEICAVTSDGHDFRHAPFPAEAASPRAFAAIATSLLDEMIAPAPWAGGFNVNVSVDVTPAAGGAHAPVPVRVGFAGPPSESAMVTAGAPAQSSPRAGDTLVEFGGVISPLTAGVEAGLAFPLSPKWRFAAMGGINRTFDGDWVVGIAAAELRHVGRGAQAHWDVGPMAGVILPDGDVADLFAGVRIGRTWELASSSVQWSITPLLLTPLTNDSTTPKVMPGAFTSLRLQFGL